jgi:hypothetical protein
LATGLSSALFHLLSISYLSVDAGADATPSGAFTLPRPAGPSWQQLTKAFAPFLLVSFLPSCLMHQLLFALVMLAVFTLFMVMPRQRRVPPTPPPSSDDDGGGEPHDPGLPDLDLPPGISRPINDWEPDYNRRPVEV